MERMDSVAVVVKHATVIRLPETSQTVIIGHPMIADISVQKNGIQAFAGKSFRATNSAMLPSAGAEPAEAHVTMLAVPAFVVTVQRGMVDGTCSGATQCEPAMQLADSQRVFSEMGGQASGRNQMPIPARSGRPDAGA